MPARKNLPPETVAAIRAAKAGETPRPSDKALAERFGVDKALVNRIVNGKAYVEGLAETAPKPQGARAPAEIPVADIGAGNNPRSTAADFFDLDELAASIAAHGVIEPVIVRRAPAGTGKRPWQLVAGERRWRAAHIAGLKTIPAIVRTLDDGDALEVALIENLQRRDMHPLDEARAFKRLKRLGRTTAEIAANIGRTERHVQKRIQVAERLPERAKALLRAGPLSLAQAEALAEWIAAHAAHEHVGDRTTAALDLVEAGKLRTEADLRAWLSPPAASPAPPAPCAPGGTSPGPAPQPQGEGRPAAGGALSPDDEPEIPAFLRRDQPQPPHPEEPPAGRVARAAASPRFTIVWETIGIGGDVRRPDVPAREVPDRILAEAPHGWHRLFRVTVERQPDPEPAP